MLFDESRHWTIDESGESLHWGLWAAWFASVEDLGLAHFECFPSTTISATVFFIERLFLLSISFRIDS